MEAVECGLKGIYPASCTGEAMVIEDNDSTKIIWKDKAGTAAQNVDCFVYQLKEMLKNQRLAVLPAQGSGLIAKGIRWFKEKRIEARINKAAVFLLYEEKSVYCKPYLLPINDLDELGSPIFQLDSVLPASIR